MRQSFGKVLMLLMLAGMLTACGSKTELQDGYYTAQAAQFSHGLSLIHI